MTAALTDVFYDDCVHEWIEVNLEPKIRKLAEVVQKGESLKLLASGYPTVL